MSRTSNLLRKCRDDLLRRGPCTVDDVIRQARLRYGVELVEERERLLDAALRREVKELMREITGDIETPERQAAIGLLPGMEPPAALAVPTDTGEYRYVPFAQAKWPDLLKARLERAANYARAGERLRDFDLKLDALRPYMQYSDNVTVADACEMLAREVA